MSEIKMDILNGRDQNEIKVLKHAYADWWQSRAFSKGARVPPFSRQEVESILDEAAEIAVRIKKHLRGSGRLDADPASLARSGGVAKGVGFASDTPESLFDIELESRTDQPSDNPEAFLRKLVVAFIRGIAKNISEEDISGYISTLLQGQRQLGKEFLATRGQYEQRITQLHREMGELIAALFPSKGDDHRKTDVLMESSVLKQLQGAVADMKEIQRSRESAVGGADSSKEGEPSEENAKPEEKKPEEKKPEEPAPPTEAEIEAAKKAEEEAEKERLRKEQEARDKGSLLQIQKAETDAASATDELLKLAELDEAHVDDPEALYKRLLQQSDQLTKDLLKLDQMENVSDDVRGKRRHAVHDVQAALDQLDTIKARLHKFVEEHRASQAQKARDPFEEALDEYEADGSGAAKEQPPEPGAAEAPKDEQPAEQKPEEDQASKEPQQPTADDQAAPQRSKKHRSRSGSPAKRMKVEDWRAKLHDLKLEVDFRSSQNSNGFELQAYVPGLNKKDIEISFSAKQRTMTISGVRLPNEQEEAKLRAHLAAYKVPKQQVNAMLLRLCAGRFGRFSETFRIPETVEMDKIQATYEDDVLQLQLPIRRQYGYERPSYGRGYPGYGSPFFGNNDYWW